MKCIAWGGGGRKRFLTAPLPERQTSGKWDNVISLLACQYKRDSSRCLYVQLSKKKQQKIKSIRPKKRLYGLIYLINGI